MIIREAAEADIVKASRLWLEMIAEMKPELTPNISWWRKIATKSLREGNYFMHVADDGGSIVGFLDYFRFPEPSTGKIHAVAQHLYLRRDLRGNGIGNMLIEAAIKSAKDMGILTMELFCFENEKPMWEKKGFKPYRSLMRMEC